ncbi:hypothetical protein [uncultured Roseobacter sp.]|uniref:hypothetical protein n=1 Tax=uncultured Roseobacter sp. TaxID=114847 RepID=UPI00261B794C|nr:hypothetical protein [uncultured Roseobacter sp.]
MQLLIGCFVKKISLILILIHAVLDNRSFAGEQKFAHCPEVWSDYVELVRDSLASSERETPSVLFVGTDGELHNCLGAQIELDTLRAVQRHETALLVVFDGDIGCEPLEWPLNVCSLPLLDWISKLNGSIILPMRRSICGMQYASIELYTRRDMSWFTLKGQARNFIAAKSSKAVTTEQEDILDMLVSKAKIYTLCQIEFKTR